MCKNILSERLECSPLPASFDKGWHEATALQQHSTKVQNGCKPGGSSITDFEENKYLKKIGSNTCGG